MGEVRTQTITIKLRLKDKHAADLNRQARSVNIVWNYCNEIQRKAVGYGRRWPTTFDLQKLTAGSSKELGLHAHTVQRVCRTYDLSRKKSARLRWRGAKSLGWVPFNTGHVVFDGEAFKFNGKRYVAMHLRGFLTQDMRFGAGSFNADSKGNWFLNIPVEMVCRDAPKDGEVGIDLGLKSLASTSAGEAITMPSFYRDSELALACAQRAKKTARVKNIHRKTANRRKDFQHKASKALCEKYGLIVVGGVSSSTLAKTRMAKSVHDAGWHSFKNMLRYKAIMHGGRYIEVNEAYSTQTCSSCGSLPSSRPAGIAGLGIREWDCSDCGAAHDRDVNAAKNILRVGLDTLAEGVSA